MGEFFKDPVSCLTLASYLITNTGGQHGLGLVSCSVMPLAIP
jgi:hypothetical protein